MKRILIVEDDPAIRTALFESMKAEHYDAVTASDGNAAYQRASSERFDMILLDLVLPSMNGEDVCQKLRSDGNTTPIIIVTSKREEVDRIVGLEIGADDYITKPYSLREMHARIRAVLRRSGSTWIALDEYSFRDIQLDFPKQTATKGKKQIRMSTMEFKIMKYLVEHEGAVVSRNELLDQVWGYQAFPTTRTVDNFILALRKKIEVDHSKPEHLLTIHGAGYRFVGDTNEA